MGITELKEKCRLAVEQAKTGTLPKSPATSIGINPPPPAPPPAQAPPAPAAPPPTEGSSPSVVAQNSPAPSVKKSPAELLAAFRKSVATPAAPEPTVAAPLPPRPTGVVDALSTAQKIQAANPKPAPKRIVLKKAPTPVDLAGAVIKPVTQVTQTAPEATKPAKVVNSDVSSTQQDFLIGTLYIDCMPVGAATINLSAVVNEVGPQVAEAAGEVHWSCLPYGTGPGILQTALETFFLSDKWLRCQDVFVMSDTKEGVALKGYLMTIARSVVVGLK